MAGRTYGPEEQAKLKKIIDEGATVLSEVEDLSAGLKDTVKAVAEELEIKIREELTTLHKPLLFSKTTPIPQRRYSPSDRFLRVVKHLW